MIENNRDWKCASHAPLVKTILKVCKPNYIMELGCGFNSTSIFAESKIPFTCIENDAVWLEQVKSQYGSTPNSEFIHHDLGPTIGVFTHFSALGSDKITEIVS